MAKAMPEANINDRERRIKLLLQTGQTMGSEAGSEASPDAAPMRPLLCCGVKVTRNADPGEMLFNDCAIIGRDEACIVHHACCMRCRKTQSDNASLFQTGNLRSAESELSQNFIRVRPQA